MASNSKARRNYGIGSVYKRKKGKSWVIDYRDENGKRVQKAVPMAETKEEAVLALKVEIAKFLEGNCVDEQKKSITFRAMTKRYLQTHAVTKKSYQTDEYRLKRMMDFFKNTELRKIDSSMVREYVTLRLREGKTESTVNREIALLKTIFNLAIEGGYLEQNPARRIKKFSESDTVRDRVLNEEEEEEQRLFAELAEHIKPVVLTALHTGLRRKKVLGLKWSDVNLSKRFIKVEKTKSGKTRYIPINSLLYEELERLKKRRNNTNRVFPFKSIRTAFYNACARAGIKDFTFHDLRRTFGTRLLENGVDIVTISKLYGHSSVLVTQRYLHPKDKLSIEAVELLAEKPQKPDHSGDNLVTSEEQSDVIH